MNFSRFLAFSAITGPAERKNSLQMRRFQTISEFSHGPGHELPRNTVRTQGPFARRAEERTSCPYALCRAKGGSESPTLTTRSMMPEARRSSVARCMIARLSGGIRLSAPCLMASSRSQAASDPPRVNFNCRLSRTAERRSRRRQNHEPSRQYNRSGLPRKSDRSRYHSFRFGMDDLRSYDPITGVHSHNAPPAFLPEQSTGYICVHCEG